MDEIAGIHRQRQITASELDVATAFFERERVAEVDWMKERFEFVKAIGTLAEDVQQQVD